MIRSLFVYSFVLESLYTEKTTKVTINNSGDLYIPPYKQLFIKGGSGKLHTSLVLPTVLIVNKNSGSRTSSLTTWMLVG